MKIIYKVVLLLIILYTGIITAQTVLPETATPKALNQPLVTPLPPNINATAYIIIDTDSGKIIAEKNSDQKSPPASLTKMMTLYVISNALHHEQIHLTDNVRISREAWKATGSRMFVKEGQQVSIAKLMRGIIVDSGNDACVAMAEHLGGSEQGFADIMNQQAQALGMTHSHFTDSNGLPDSNHYTTAKDLAILGRALINDFPQYYHFYKQKWFTFNDIKQPNRNRLLWRDAQVDGIKTGHTDEAGFCLIASAKRDNMRLMTVILGAPNDTTRTDDSERLLNYGFRFFETYKVYQAQQTITQIKIYKGVTDNINVGVLKNKFVTIPTGQYKYLIMKLQTQKNLQAPIEANTKIGDVLIELNNKVIETYPLYALNTVQLGGLFQRLTDNIALAWRNWFHS